MSRGEERRDHAPFMEVDPPNWVAQGLSYILISIFVVVVLLSILVRFPETVSCSFVLVPIQPADPIRSLYDGTIREVRTLEGDSVAKGSTIFVMRSDTMLDRASEYRSVETRNKGATESLENAKKKFESQLKSDQEEIQGLKHRNENLKRTISLKSDQLTLMNEKLDRYKKLYETGISSHTDVTDQELEVKKFAVELEALQREMADNELASIRLQNGITTRRVEFEESKHSWEQEIERTRMRMDMLKGSMTAESDQELLVPSPCSGTILRLKASGSGAVVQDGDVLAEIVCSSTPLQAEMNVPQSGVGRIKAGQNVKLLYDSFPFQRYGVKMGTVKWIAPAASTPANDSGFRVVADIAEDFVNVSGQRRLLSPGMGGIAEVVVGRRSIISYAFEPIRQLRENMK